MMARRALEWTEHELLDREFRSAAAFEPLRSTGAERSVCWRAVLLRQKNYLVLEEQHSRYL